MNQLAQEQHAFLAVLHRTSTVILEPGISKEILSGGKQAA